MASGFIYVIILAMWGTYFLPRWISEHDTQSGRAIKRYKSAMKIVASTPNTPDKVDPEKKLKSLRQRRALIGSLTFALAATLSVIVAGYLPVSTLLIPMTGFAIGVVHVRRQVVAAQLKKRRLKALAIITTAEIKLDPSVRIDLSVREASLRQASLRQIQAEQTKQRADRLQAEESQSAETGVEDTEHWIPLRDRAESSTVTIIPKEDRAWSPIAVPRPTYATAPKAVRSKRVVDLTDSGQWSAELEREEALALPRRDDLFDQELLEEAAVEHTRVVNE
jgi:hypothetical protein